MSAAIQDGAETFDADVLVVGAGPVGQTLSIDLARRGVSVVLIERNETCLQHPKMERCNSGKSRWTSSSQRTSAAKSFFTFRIRR